MGEPTKSHVVFKNGNLYIDAPIYEKYFASVDAVILLNGDGKILILPVHSQSSGGNLLKIRNAKGDRCVSAVSFLRQNGFEDSFERICSVAWDNQSAALVADLN